MANNVGIILINWNNESDTIDCLASLQKHVSSDLISVLLIDNNSTDDISGIRSLEVDYPLEIIENETNRGFAGGNNQGMRYFLEQDDVDYVMLLNNDTVLLENCITPMRRVFENFQDVGIVGCINYYYDDPGTVWQYGFMINSVTGGMRRPELSSPGSGDPVDVDYVPGSSFMIRKSAMADIGFLDEEYFAYWEETDYCTRAKEAGWRVVFAPHTRLLHKVDHDARSPQFYYYTTRNKLRFFRKQRNLATFPAIFILTLLRSLCTAAGLLFDGKTSHVHAPILGILHFLRGRFGPR